MANMMGLQNETELCITLTLLFRMYDVSTTYKSAIELDFTHFLCFSVCVLLLTLPFYIEKQRGDAMTMEIKYNTNYKLIYICVCELR